MGKNQYVYNPFTNRLDAVRDITETIAHGDLSDMPDATGANGDHDTRYLKLNQTAPQTVLLGTPIFDEGLTTNDTITNYGNLQMLTDGTVFEIWTHDVDAIKIMSAGSNYSKLSFGVNTTTGYVYLQSVKHGSGTLLPISMWVGSLRAWDVSTSGHLLSGGTGATYQNIGTVGQINAGRIIVLDPSADGLITINAEGSMNYLTLSSNDAGTSDIYSVEQLYFRCADNDFTFMHNLYTGAYFRINIAGTNPLLTSSTGIFDFDNDNITTTGTITSANQVVSKQTEVDFGSTPVESATFTITDASITTSSVITGQLAYVAPTGKDLDELEFDTFDLRFSPAAGSCTVYARSTEGYVADKFKINYTYNKA